jgi:hypothetical protein
MLVPNTNTKTRCTLTYLEADGNGYGVIAGRGGPSRPPPRASVNLVPLLLTGVRLHPPGRTDKNLCRCFGAPARRVSPDHLITCCFPSRSVFQPQKFACPTRRKSSCAVRLQCLMAIGRASLAALLFGLFVVASVLLQKRGSFRGPTDSAASALHNSLELAERQLTILKSTLETSSATNSRLMRDNARLREETGRLENLLAKLPSRRAPSTMEATTTVATAPAKPAEPAKPLPSGYRTPSALSERLLESTEFNKEVPPSQHHTATLSHSAEHRCLPPLRVAARTARGRQQQADHAHLQQQD